MVGLDSILGYVGFISTLVGWFPTNPDQGQVRIKYWAGRDGWNNGFELKESGGELPKVDIRSTSNEWVGHGTMALQWIGSNDQRQVDVDMSKNQEINYLTFTHDGYDATCLALIGWTPNESIPNAERRKGYIIGDIFRLCGWAWNHSGQSVRIANTNKYQDVNCGWMVADKNGRDGFVGLLNINLDVMGEHFIGDYKGKDLCFWGVGMASGRYPRPKKRSLHSPDEHAAAFGNQVRVHKSLSAIELCDSPTSWGSSFFSIEEGVFCDMSTKTKVPVCKAGETEGCFVYERPVVNGRGVYSTKRNVGIRGSTVKYNATYFVTRDENGRVLDDGKGH
ncbi:hypothetical protein BGZ80_004921 [Entomortierella chlamydospora]|uniref:Uncharacterized protein n=1 Tax=Entomortierella chlamydospora TaxID=101097 RepID=A0A9P6SVR8_9FUNG|nr:hypothetical protein BGZ80_004921 [Entomortierella chlamydospora]